VVNLRPAVFLDRDGVVNAAIMRDARPYPPQSMDEVEILPGVVEAVRTFRKAGLATVVVTNQPDIARGAADARCVSAINECIAEQTGIEHFFVCPHDDEDGCECRKPRPGMILNAADVLGLDLTRSVMVGDRWRDIAAGIAAGVSTVFIDRDYDERVPPRPTLVVSDLPDAVPWILHHTRGLVP
jgi:D-glycero-D-manno-heptose 1,7-bisphosphate phosphatase